MVRKSLIRRLAVIRRLYIAPTSLHVHGDSVLNGYMIPGVKIGLLDEVAQGHPASPPPAGTPASGIGGSHRLLSCHGKPRASSTAYRRVPVLAHHWCTARRGQKTRSISGMSQKLNQ